MNIRDIKPGICLIVETWENDGDNVKINYAYGLNQEETQATIEMVKMFKSENDTNDGRLGNSENVDVDIAVVIANHLQSVLVELTTDALAKAISLYTDLIGTWCDGEYFRVYEDFQVIEFSDMQVITAQYE